MPENPLHPTILLAFLCYGSIHLALIWIEHQYLPRLHPGPASEWISARILLPVARIGGLLAFLVLSYPFLFGLHDAPPIAAILFENGNRISDLVNIAFLLSIVLPVVPPVGARPSIVLPVQGITASALLLSWLAAVLGLGIDLWPSWTTLGLIVLWLVAGEYLSAWLALRVGPGLNRRFAYTDAEQLIYQLLIFAVQIPAILIYTLNRGHQLIALMQ